MSKIKIEGNASGTGTFTLSTPNSNTDRALTLPDSAGEILTNASGLSATNLTSGTIPDDRFPSALPALDGSALTNISASGVASSTYATTGYVELDDGLIINWFYGYKAAGNFTVTWAQTYPTAFIGTWASLGANAFTQNDYLSYIRTQNTSSVTVGNGVAGYAQLISIGY